MLRAAANKYVAWKNNENPYVFINFLFIGYIKKIFQHVIKVSQISFFFVMYNLYEIK